MRTFGLIGKKLQHSFSANYFHLKFLSGNIQNCTYKLFEIEAIDQLPYLIKSMPELEGFNVTIPYKKSVIPFLDHVDEITLKVGAVNTVKILRSTKKYELIGFNTDVIGFEKSTYELQKVKGALILGTGGGAEAVAYVFSKLNIPFLMVSRDLRSQQIIGYEDLTKELLKEYPMIVNTTPVGMSPAINAEPQIPYEFLSSDNFLYDLIYNPDQTQFLQKGKMAGARTLNGLKMLQIQADESWNIWNTIS